MMELLYILENGSTLMAIPLILPLYLKLSLLDKFPRVRATSFTFNHPEPPSIYLSYVVLNVFGVIDCVF